MTDTINPYLVARNHYLFAIVFFLGISLLITIKTTVDFDVLFFQLLTILLSTLFFVCSLKKNTSKYFFYTSLIYGCLLVGLFHLFGFLDLPPDGYNYMMDAETAAMRPGGIIEENLKFVDAVGSSAHIDDLGYMIICTAAHRIFGLEGGELFLELFKVLIHAFSCQILFKLCKKYLTTEKNSAIITSLWAFNTYIGYFATSKLKEPVFAFVILSAVYYMYKVIDRKTVINAVIFATWTALSFLFRAVAPIYFIAAFIICKYFQRFLKTKTITLGIIFSIILVAFGSNIFIRHFSSAAGMIMDRLEENQGIATQILNIINVFIAPYPAFSTKNQEVSLYTAQYAIINSAFSVFVFLGMFRAIKYEIKCMYPLMIVLMINSLMLIITGFSMNPRYTYITVFLAYAFIPIGFYYVKKKGLIITFMLFLGVVTYMYNLR